MYRPEEIGISKRSVGDYVVCLEVWLVLAVGVVVVVVVVVEAVVVEVEVVAADDDVFYLMIWIAMSTFILFHFLLSHIKYLYRMLLSILFCYFSYIYTVKLFVPCFFIYSLLFLLLRAANVLPVQTKKKSLIQQVSVIIIQKLSHINSYVKEALHAVNFHCIL